MDSVMPSDTLREIHEAGGELIQTQHEAADGMIAENRTTGACQMNGN